MNTYRRCWFPVLLSILLRRVYLYVKNFKFDQLMLQQISDGLNNYLLCLVKYKENVYASNVVLLNKNTITRDGAINKFSVQFSNKFLLSDIYSDFKITVELYSMTTEGYIVKQEKKVTEIVYNISLILMMKFTYFYNYLFFVRDRSYFCCVEYYV